MKALGPIPPEVYRALTVRLVMLIVFAGSVGLALWSLKQLPPAERKLEQQNKRIATLESEIQFLEMKPSPLEAEQVAAKYKQAQQLLFSGLDEARGWEQFKRQPERLLLTADPEVRFLGKTQALSILSANLELQATNSPYSRYTNSTYKALLDFAQQLTSQSKRADLMELTVSGNSNSVSVAKIVLHLWTQETGP